MNETPKFSEQDVLKIIEALKRFELKEKLSDEELVEKVIEEVWGKLVLGSEEDGLLDELITRFERKSGIERDENGNILPKKSGWKS